MVWHKFHQYKTDWSVKGGAFWSIPVTHFLHGVTHILPQVNLEWADEWIVEDGNSTDGTIEEAKKLGFDVIQQKGDG